MTRTLALLALILLCATDTAIAQDWIWPNSPSSTRQYQRYQRYQQYAPRYYARREYRAYRPVTRYYGDDHDDHLCKPRMHAVGDARLSLGNAKAAAAKVLAASILFHWGEKYVDFVNARDVEFTCTRAGINDTWIGKLQEGAGQIHTRCEIVARPCRAPRILDEGK